MSAGSRDEGQNAKGTKRDPRRDALVGWVGARKEERGEVGKAWDVCLGGKGFRASVGFVVVARIALIIMLDLALMHHAPCCWVFFLHACIGNNLQK